MNSQGKYHCSRSMRSSCLNFISYLARSCDINFFISCLVFQPGISFTMNRHFTYEQKNTHIKSASPSCIVVQHRKGSVLTSIPCRSIGSLSIVFHNSREWKAEKYNYLGTSRVAQINNAKTAQIFLKMLLMAGNCKVRSGWHWWENAHNAILHHPRFKSFTLNTEKKRWKIYFSGFFFLQK